MKEVWNPLRGYEGVYWISNLCRIRNARHNTLKPVSDGGVMKYDLRNNGQRELKEITAMDYESSKGVNYES